MRHYSIAEGKFDSVTIMRSKLLRAARDWFDSNSFLEISVPHITGATGSCEWFPNAMPVTMYNEKGNEANMFLRQTGQLYLEAFTLSHNRVFTIGPSFRQERKVTNRHLCEFTLIEFEGRDFELDGLMDNIEALIKAMYKEASTTYKNHLIDMYVKQPFARVRYDDVIEMLQKEKFEISIGDDLGSVEEQAICALNGQMPTFVTHYPSNPKPKKGGVIKFFSMKRENGHTFCCDLLLPMVGESVGGAVREGSADLCKKQFEESYMFDHLVDAGVDPEQFKWYFEVLDKGQGQSSGCGIGFDRVVQSIMATEQKNTSIKQAVELPRSPEHLVP